jgi:hypothetical protein
MKKPLLEKVQAFKKELQALKREVAAVPVERISRKDICDHADAIATMWVEELRSPLEHKAKLPGSLIERVAVDMKQLHVLRRPNNRKTSYQIVLDRTLRKFDDNFILPIQQSATEVESVFDLQKLVPGLADPEESAYLKEAVECAESGHRRAAVVLGWCAAIDKIQRKIIRVGLDKFNATSRRLKAQTSGKYKRWNKEFSVSTLAELQTVFDTDLIVVLEGMELLDGNEAERMETCFQYRNHSAHPGEAPIAEPNVVAFFSDISAIILQNHKFNS